MGDGVAQSVEHQLEIQRPEVRTPFRAQEQFVRISPSENAVLTRCRYAPPPCVYARHKHDHARTHCPFVFRCASVWPTTIHIARCWLFTCCSFVFRCVVTWSTSSLFTCCFSMFRCSLFTVHVLYLHVHMCDC